MTQWLKTVSAGLCILTILLHLIPQGKFARYVRFYAGLLFFLMAAEPVWELFAGEGELERLMELEFLKEDYYELETSVKGMEELKNDSIERAYQQEICRQIEELAGAYGLTAQIQTEFEKEDGFTLKRVVISSPDAEAEVLEAVCQEIAGVYLLEQKDIRVVNIE